MSKSATKIKVPWRTILKPPQEDTIRKVWREKEGMGLLLATDIVPLENYETIFETDTGKKIMPEDVIVVISTHGVIKYNVEKKVREHEIELTPPTFRMTQLDHLTKVTFAPPGASAFTFDPRADDSSEAAYASCDRIRRFLNPEITADSFFHIIQKHLSESGIQSLEKSKKLTSSQLSQFARNTTTDIRDFYIEKQLPILQSDLALEETECGTEEACRANEDIMDLRFALDTIGDSFQLFDVPKGTLMIDKSFGYESLPERKSIGQVFKISILNVYDEVDGKVKPINLEIAATYDGIPSTGIGKYVSLEKLLTYLSLYGVNQAVIFDCTCSALRSCHTEFFSDEEYLSCSQDIGRMGIPYGGKRRNNKTRNKRMSKSKTRNKKRNKCKTKKSYKSKT